MLEVNDNPELDTEKFNTNIIELTAIEIVRQFHLYYRILPAVLNQNSAITGNRDGNELTDLIKELSSTDNSRLHHEEPTIARIVSDHLALTIGLETGNRKFLSNLLSIFNIDISLQPQYERNERQSDDKPPTNREIASLMREIFFKEVSAEDAFEYNITGKLHYIDEHPFETLWPEDEATSKLKIWNKAAESIINCFRQNANEASKELFYTIAETLYFEFYGGFEHVVRDCLPIEYFKNLSQRLKCTTDYTNLYPQAHNKDSPEIPCYLLDAA